MEHVGKRFNIYENSSIYNRYCNGSTSFCIGLVTKNLGLMALENVVDNSTKFKFIGGGARYVDGDFSLFAWNEKVSNESNTVNLLSGIDDLVTSFFVRNDLVKPCKT